LSRLKLTNCEIWVVIDRDSWRPADKLMSIVGYDCIKDGIKAGSLTVESGGKAMAFGNLLFDGIIGGAVDAGTGAAFDYPTSMQVVMGRDIRIDKEETEEE